MKTVFSYGVFGFLFMYFFVSLFNHTWNMMRFTQNSVVWWAILTALFTFIGIGVNDFEKK